MNAEVDKTNEVYADQVQVKLPSRGLFYEGTVPEGVVTLRPIMVKEEKLMMGARNRLSVMDRILERCLIDCKLPLNKFLMTDKFFLMMQLRSISYGAEYIFKQKCPNCDGTFQHTILLPEGLSMKVSEPSDKEPFEVKLPRSKKTVALRFLRGEDEEAIEKYIQMKPNASKEEGDPGYEYRMATQLVTIDGKEMDVLERLCFCENLTGMDSLAIRRAVSEKEPGLDLSIQCVCPSCRTEIHTGVQLTNEFFPSNLS